jgi:putative transposase
MYRLLSEHAEVRERRGQLRHPVYAAPELLARRPNERWSWDITKLLGPAKWTYFYLYVMLDVFSRYVVGWMVAHRESATLAQKFIGETCARQGINRGQDAEVPADFPERFGAIQDARAHCHVFFPWYNTDRHHSGLGLLTPADVHYDLAEQRVGARATVLATAYAAHPAHFPLGRLTLRCVPRKFGSIRGRSSHRRHHRRSHRLHLLRRRHSPSLLSIRRCGRQVEADGSLGKAQEG